MNLFNMTNRANLNVINKILTAVIFCFGIAKAWGQQEGDPFQLNVTDKMFLPTPEQASLLKFIDIPTGNHTGVHGYSVPIYTIQGKDFSLPISISYHGGGIKVDELSSSIGIGWALNIGGISLSEEVRGERDLDNTIEKLNYFQPMNFNPDYGDPSQGGSEHYKAALRMTGIQTTGVEGVPEAELQPDYFSYSLLNNSGRFILDNNKIAHTIPKDDVNIFMIPPANIKQHIIDNKGIIYYFSTYLQDHVPGINAPRVRYSYKIDEIVIPNSGSIVFEYYKVSYKYISSRSKTKKIKFNNLQEEPTGISETESSITEYLPKSVTYKQTKVNFKYKMNGGVFLGRLDVNEGNGVPGSNKGAILEYIEVADIAKPTVPIKNYKLITDYFDTVSNRLKLKAVEDVIQGTDYIFKYIGEDKGKFLPPRFSYEQDYWGMYNGKGNNTSVPEIHIQKNGETVRIPGANKDPDKDFAVIGSLESVKLPTGGSQVFEYELDQFRNVEFEDDTTGIPVHNLQNYELSLADYFFDFNAPEYNLKIIDIPPFTPDYRLGFNAKFHFQTDQPITFSSDGLPLDNYYVAGLYETGTNQPIINPTYVSGEYELPSLDPLKSYHVKFYKVQGGNTNPPDKVSIQMGLTWTHDHVTTPLHRNAGTLRVKSITLNDADGKPQIKKSYKYTNFDNQDDPNISSGFFTGTRPFPWTYQTSYTEYNDGGDITYHFIHIPDNALQNANTSFGKSVIYKKVTETYVSTTDTLDVSKNYRKEYIFSTPGEYTRNSGIPILAPSHEEYLYGLLLEERIWNNQNQLVKVTRNDYNNEEPDFFFNQFSANYYNNPNSQNFSGILSPSLAVAHTGFTIVYVASLPMMVHQFGKNFNSITSAWVKLQTTKEENYENGVLKMTNTTNYNYSPTYNHLNPVSVTTTNSLGQEIKTEYEYNHPNKKDEPTTVRTFQNGAAISVQQTTYQTAGLPQYVFAKKGASTLDNVPPSEDLKVTYNSYDAHGNLTQYTLENESEVSIIWGYNGQHPIAKVEGVAYTALTSYISTLQPASNNGTLTAASFELLRNLSGAIVTSYIYKPLVGVTSIIHPNGQVEYYDYDTAGRLKEVYIMDGTNKRIIKTMDYHYKP